MNYEFYGNDKRFEYLEQMLNEAGHVKACPANIGIASVQSPIPSCKFAYGGKGFVYSDEYRKQNSIYTAEGALALAIENTPDALCESTVLVLGFGFLGRETAILFRKAGADITIATNDILERDMCFKMGFKTLYLHELKERRDNIILNTIPANVLFDEMIASDCQGILIELASIPCTSPDFKALPIISGRALPGRFSPRSAAKLMFRDISQMLKEADYE